MPKRLAQPHRLFQHRVEHRREVAGRGVDDLQYLGGRGLLLQRFARLGEEPRVLHRDDRLRGEILEQRDLLVGERSDLLAVDDDCAEQHLSLRSATLERLRAPPDRQARVERLGPSGNRLLPDIGEMDDVSP